MIDLKSTTDRISEADQAGGSTEDTQEKREIRNRIRNAALSNIRAAVTSTSALTQADLDSYERIGLSEQGLEQGGARTHEDKKRFLEQTASRYIPEVIADVKRMESDFLSKVNNLESKGMDKASAQRWRDWLKKGDKLWFQKKVFLQTKFPTLHRRWTELLSDESKLDTKIKLLKKDSRSIPEIKAYLASDYKRGSISKREVIVNNALASIAAHEKGRVQLYRKAQSVLQGAVTRGVLAPNKVSVWMRRIFESNADDKLITAFLNGGGHDSLTSMMGRWTKVRGRFDEIEKKRNGSIVQGFHFVTVDTFLHWRYDAREAYADQAERRLQESPEGIGYRILLDIRRELDMKDWRSAQSLMDKAKMLRLSQQERGELTSMEQYLSTQKSIEPQTIQDEEHDADPNADMFKALAELQKINPGVYNLYRLAMERGIGALSALCSLMYNRCWCREHSVMEGSDESRLREQAKEETEEIAEYGHHEGYENNYIPGHGKEVIRDQSKGEWSPQVLHIANDTGAQTALVAKCESQQNNYSFKYWSTLIPENLGYSAHQYIVFNLNWRLKSGLRKAGSLSKNTLISSQSLKKQH